MDRASVLTSRAEEGRRGRKKKKQQQKLKVDLGKRVTTSFRELTNGKDNLINSDDQVLGNRGRNRGGESGSTKVVYTLGSTVWMILEGSITLVCAPIAFP